jgi:hypothetical protein
MSAYWMSEITPKENRRPLQLAVPVRGKLAGLEEDPLGDNTSLQNYATTSGTTHLTYLMQLASGHNLPAVAKLTVAAAAAACTTSMLQESPEPPGTRTTTISLSDPCEAALQAARLSTVALVFERPKSCCCDIVT